MGEPFLCMYVECHCDSFGRGGSCLKVSSSGGSSANETSWEISARVFTWKVPVRLMTMGMILTSAFRVP